MEKNQKKIFYSLDGNSSDLICDEIVKCIINKESKIIGIIMNYKVSLIIPTFNRSDLLEPALKSLVGQEFFII